jgi:hypothetical protein
MAKRRAHVRLQGDGGIRLDQVETFIAHWSAAQGAERANAQGFLIGLCGLLGVAAPAPADGAEGPYRFERRVTHRDASERATRRFIDLYKRGCFILEAKQGTDAPQASLLGLSDATRRQVTRNSAGWVEHMLRAKGQAEGYARDLPVGEPSPPFLIVCDIGFCFDLYADFSGTGRHYAQFPDGQGFRIYLEDLRRADIRARLVAVWDDPHSLDPSRRRREVTREIAALLARLAQTLERRHPADDVAFFLIRCIFCMFTQSVGLLPGEGAFSALLETCRGKPAAIFVGLVGDLWRSMNAGGFSAALAAVVKRFNGGLFSPARHGGDPLAVDADELALLIMASGRNWAEVEPAIFGTLLEDALTVRQRGQYGAHFTPREFVERLVLPAVMEPLRAEWDSFKATSGRLVQKGDRVAAAAELRRFHTRLCSIRVLDPACGTGNFLYVTMELMKRLEGEVLDALANVEAGAGEKFQMPGESVDPHQFLGLEKNPRAVPVAELVLWIGHLQWHFRTRGAGQAPPEPILKDFKNIRQADALLSYTKQELLRDGRGVPITRWDGVGRKLHPITGEMVPDETARAEVSRPVNAKMTPWPEADFIVGNPPFIAGKDMRAELGEGYAQALWGVYRSVPDSADIALFFWWRAAQVALANKSPLVRFGFITSNSIRQVFCRKVVAGALAGKRRVRLMFAIPDHPWSDASGAAAVRIAMTVGERAGRADGAMPRLVEVVRELAGGGDAPAVTLCVREGVINADLTIGADLDQALALRANEGICSPGVKLHGAGFIVTPHEAAGLGLGRIKGMDAHIRPYLNGRDLTQRSRGAMVIDLDGCTEREVRTRFPSVYQHVLLKVKPERDQNNEAYRRENWWLFGRNNAVLRAALRGLPRYIATVETAKHRVFCFLPAEVLPDNMLVCIASDAAFHLGVLSSRFHVAWALAAGGRLGVGNDPRYNKTRCFDPFPFPEATRMQRAEIGALAEEIDGLRRGRLDAHPQLTMTGLYNVLAALREGRVLSAAERDIHEAGQVSVLRDLHDRLDAAVAQGYGWPVGLASAEIVQRVVALNNARRAEEAAGVIAWLRPSYQDTAAPVAAQGGLAVEEGEAVALPAWPTREQERLLVLRSSLAAAPGSASEVAGRFARARPRAVAEMLDTLVAYGQARQAADGAYRL